MNEPFSILEQAYADRLAGARHVKRTGGKVVGVVSTAVPVELIEAAGCYAVMITGDSRNDTPLADVWMESTFDPMARAIFQSALAGELEFLDALVIPRTADSFLRLYLYLRELERQNLSARLPPRVFLYDLLQTPGADAERHNVAQLRSLHVLLAEIAGRNVNDDELRAAIGASNANRRLQRELLTRRRAERNLDGAAVIKAIGSRYYMSVDAHSTALQKWLRSLSCNGENPSAPRILVAGNAQDNVELHTLLDQCGLHVVGDYHWLGDACAEEIAIAAGSDPWAALSRHYHLHSLSSRRFPNSPADIVAHARLCTAQGVVFYLFEAEEALTWDAPNQARALHDAGIATLILESQPHTATASAELPAKLKAFDARLRGATS